MRWLLLLMLLFATPLRAATLEVAASTDFTGLDPMAPGATVT